MFLMYKFNSTLVFEEISSSYFLYYSWVELKNNYVLNKKIYKPVSLVWFKKASFLLRKSLYKYGTKKFFSSKDSNLHRYSMFNFRNKIIENAIFNAIFPFFNVKFIKDKCLLSNNMCFWMF